MECLDQVWTALVVRTDCELWGENLHFLLLDRKNGLDCPSSCRSDRLAVSIGIFYCPSRSAIVPPFDALMGKTTDRYVSPKGTEKGCWRSDNISCRQGGRGESNQKQRRLLSARLQFPFWRASRKLLMVYILISLDLDFLSQVCCEQKSAYHQNVVNSIHWTIKTVLLFFRTFWRIAR